MKKFLLLFLAILVVCILLVVGCAKPSTTSQTTTTNPPPTATTTTNTPLITTTTASTVPTSQASTPQGELVFVVDSLGTDNFQVLGAPPPAWAEITNERWIRFQYSNEQTGFYPSLAERWEFSPDYLTMDVYVRQGVQWQGGYGELTADDFQYTFSVLHKDASKGALELWWWGPPDQGGFIKSTEVIDKYHWRINFSAVPYTSWLADSVANYFIFCSKKYFETVGYDKAIQEPIGTGPWQLIEHVPGSYMKFEAFDQYWGQKPAFKYLTIKCVPEKDSQIAMLQTGEADIAEMTPDKITKVQAAGMQVLNIPESTGVYLEFGGQLLSTDPNFDPTCPWASHTDELANSDWNQRALKVRQALNMVIYRDAIRSKIMQGACTPMTTYLYPPSIPGYKSEWKEIPYNPDQAKQLLTEAGYPNGFEKPITMFVDSGRSFSGPVGKEVALTIADELEALGLQVNRQVVDQSGFEAAWTYGHQDAWCMNVSNQYVFWYPTDWWQWVLAYNGPLHDAFMHPDFDKIIGEYNQAADKGEAEQTRIMQEGTDWIYNNYMFAPIAYLDKTYAMGPKVGGLSQYEVYWANASAALNFEFFTHAK